MLGHRKLNVEDYLAIVKRRRWLILAPAILVPLLAVAISFFIPSVYVSQTLVLIEDKTVPDDLVKSVVATSINSRLASMREQILSRSRIQPIIEHYNLYASKHISMDDRVDLTRKDILIVPIKSDIAAKGGLPGFFISFKASDARTAQQVCGEITSLFVAENLHIREQSAQGTTDFLKGQLDDAKRSLDENDAKLAAFQRQYIGKLPGQEAPNINMLTTLNTQLEAATQALGRMQQDKAYQESMLTQQIQNAQPISTPNGPVMMQSPGAGQTELQTLLTQERDLANHYTADYPDLKATRRRIAELQKNIAQAPAAPASTAAANPLNAPPSRFDNIAIQQLRSQVRSADIGIKEKEREQASIQSNIHLYQDRIQASPMVEAQYKELTRDYETAKKFYDSLLAKSEQAKMATDLERRQQGEQFRVMDEPNLPDAPTFPNRPLFALGGLVFGFAIGLALAAFLEYKDTSLRTEQDIWAFTKLPTLAVIAYSGPLADKTNHHPTPMGRFKRLFGSKTRRGEFSKVQA